jgi:hypothetical protein
MPPARLRHERVEFADAARFVQLHHRHHTPPVGHLFSIGAYCEGELVGVVIVGRPVARFRQDGLTAEVTRLCVLDDKPNACSFLYGKAAKAALAMGFRRIGTYTLKRESGASLRGAGWICIGDAGGGSWNRPSRLRSDDHPLERKTLWEVTA